MACDDIVVEGNIISGNDFPGMAFTDFSLASNTANDPDSDPSPNRPAILNSVMCNNGNSPAPRVRAILAAMLESRVPDIVDPGGIAEYAANPVKKRPDYPQMPLQAHLDRETLLAAAKHMLKVER